MSIACDDLYIGGTLNSAGITGGVSITNSRAWISDWSGLVGTVGKDIQLIEVAGRAVPYVVGDGTPRIRLVTLNLTVSRWATTGRGSLTEASEGAQLEANTDAIFTYLSDPDGFYLERVMADGSKRFVHGYAIDPTVFSSREFRKGSIPIRCDTPFWRSGGTESSDSLSGSDTLSNAGNARLYDPVLTFPSTGATLAADDGSWSIATAATSAAVTVDLGARTVVRGGTNVDALLSLANGVWPFFKPGSTAVTVTGSAIGVTWRNPWES